MNKNKLLLHKLLLSQGFLTKIRSAFLFIFFQLVLTPLSANAANEQQQGINAFRDGDYKTALQYFHSAQSKENTNPTLLYNLGVSYFKLKKWNLSAKHFTTLANMDEWKALANYNLGRVEEERNNPQQAKQYYLLALKGNTLSKLKKLIQYRLNANQGEPIPISQWFGVTGLELGYDDNAILVTDTGETPSSGKSDTFTVLFGSISTFFSGDFNRGYNWTGSLYIKKYADLSNLDFSGVFNSLSFHTHWHSLKFVSGMGIDVYFFAGEHFTTESRATLQINKAFNFASLRVKNTSTYIDGSNHYNHLDGFKNQLSVEIKSRQKTLNWRLGYKWEYNDRDDLFTDTQFLSYSPARHSLYLKSKYKLNNHWQIHGRLEYKDSQYDKNKISATTTRQDDHIKASTSLHYAPNNEWDIFLKYRYVDNDSNFDNKDYSTQQISIGMQSLF